MLGAIRQTSLIGAPDTAAKSLHDKPGVRLDRGH
jgi:hypothetical protein